jgi:hypothetical protein
MNPLSDQQRKAVQAVLAQALVSVRSYVSTAASRGGLDAATCRELNKLLNIVHNVPSMVEETYALGFDEAWFIRALRSFDERNGTSFARTFADQAGTSPDHQPGVQGRHLAEQADLAGALTAVPAEIVEHHYSETDFGSWWTLIRCRGQRFRLVFDGRDRAYRLEHDSNSEFGTTWNALWEQVNASEHAVRDAVVEVLRGTK